MGLVGLGVSHKGVLFLVSHHSMAHHVEHAFEIFKNIL